MARTRDLKPGFFENEDLAECEPLARILFAGLWTIADREGRLENRPKKIKAKLLPYDDCDISQLLDQLEKFNLIARYEVEGGRYIVIPGFSKNQKIHPNEAPSLIPAPEYIPNRDLSRQNTINRDETPTNIPLPSFTSLPSKHPLPPQGGCVFFEKFKLAYPPGHRTGLSRARSLWMQNNLDGRFDEILAGLEVWKKSEKWKTRGFVHSLENFLKDELWLSPPAPAKGQPATEKWRLMMAAKRLQNKFDRSIELDPQVLEYSNYAGGYFVHRETGEKYPVSEYQILEA